MRTTMSTTAEFLCHSIEAGGRHRYGQVAARQAHATDMLATGERRLGSRSSTAISAPGARQAFAVAAPMTGQPPVTTAICRAKRFSAAWPTSPPRTKIKSKSSSEMALRSPSHR